MKFISDFNFFHLLMLVGILQGLLFIIAVGSRKKLQSHSSRYLAGTVFSLSLANLQPILIDMNISVDNSLLLSFYLPWELVVIPCLYLFTKSYLLQSVSKYYYILMFAPFVALSCFKWIRLALGFESEETISWMYASSKTMFFVLQSFSASFSLFLIFMIMRVLHKYQVQHTVSTIKRSVRWLALFLKSSLVGIFLWFMALILFWYIKPDHLYFHYPFWLFLSALIYMLSYIGISKAKLFEQRDSLRIAGRAIKPTVSDSNNTNHDDINEFKRLLYDERQFLNADLSLSYMATKLGLSETRLSQLINQHLDTNFVNLVNSARIGHAKKLLADTRFVNYTIVSIALESGFNSKSAFYNAFKKNTGTTPSQFKDNCMLSSNHNLAI